MPNQLALPRRIAAWSDLNGQPDQYVNRWTRPGRLYAADGTTLKQLAHVGYTTQIIVANGDRFQLFHLCAGTETKLNLSTYKHNNCGIFDLYVNGVLDSAGYDDYSSVAISVHRDITLTRPIVPGLNTIEFRVNGKNASSTNYLLQIYGASLQ